MGEHGTWFDYLNRFDWWRHLDLWAKAKLGRTSGLAMFETGWTLTHVLITLLVIVFCAWGAIAFFRGTQSADQGLVPPRKMNLRNFFEFNAESVYGMVEGAMGEDNAPRFFPLIGALWLFILFNNLIGLIPGFVAATDTVKTNLGLALFVFVLTHVYGVKEHGLAYFKHFLGPSPALIPLMLPIELISHVARPLSLTVRLMGNMMADHKVVMSFFALVPLLVPLPFLLLGLLVCGIQALVFCTLTMVYIGMAIEHEEH
ncbi:MAG TPA: F0F1 ATP synthase subunit A [Kofleriaceae bacterium]|jgi:F-type H+-transporting ATPase subunit a|nr:F0F1 ATP synthase subunit A [Kofleriaceae bacterium]